jgi:hypothetical protein
MSKPDATVGQIAFQSVVVRSALANGGNSYSASHPLLHLVGEAPVP